MERPVAPHGIEHYPRHAVVCAGLKSPGTGEERLIDVLLLPADVAAEQCTANGGYTKEASQRTGANGLRLLFHEDAPGYALLIGRKQSVTTSLTVCAGGVLLPGQPPALDYRPGEAEAYPFCFLVGVSTAIRTFTSWTRWANQERLDSAALYRYVWDIPAAPSLEWFSVPHSEAEMREAGLRRWSGPPEPEDWPGEHGLWLLRAEWVNDIPQGMELVSISGKRVPFVREHNIGPEAERGGGALAFGLLAVEAQDE